MKKIVYILLLTTWTLSGCSPKDKNETDLAAVFPAKAESVKETPVLQDSGSDEKQEFNEFIVQRKKDCFNFSYDSIKDAGIIDDMKALLWIVPRGGAGITEVGMDTDSSELPVIEASDNAILNNYTTDSTNKDYTWIRLDCDMYIPEAGVNAMKHKDIVIYVDPENPGNAVFAMQNPDNLSEWNITTMPDYGKWLTKEIDMLLRTREGL